MVIHHYQSTVDNAEYSVEKAVATYSVRKQENRHPLDTIPYRPHRIFQYAPSSNKELDCG